MDVSKPRGELIRQRRRLRQRLAALAAAGVLVPAVGAGVLPAVDAEVERRVEGVQLRGGQDLLLRADAVTDGVGQGVLAQDVVLEPGQHASGAADSGPL